MIWDLIPAYGRQIQSRAAARASWEAGQDWSLCLPSGQTYANQESAETEARRSGASVWVNLRTPDLSRLLLVVEVSP